MKNYIFPIVAKVACTSGFALCSFFAHADFWFAPSGHTEFPHGTQIFENPFAYCYDYNGDGFQACDTNNDGVTDQVQYYSDERIWLATKTGDSVIVFGHAHIVPDVQLVGNLDRQYYTNLFYPDGLGFPSFNNVGDAYHSNVDKINGVRYSERLSLLMGRNISKGATSYTNFISAQLGDEIRFRAHVRNNGNRALNHEGGVMKGPVVSKNTRVSFDGLSAPYVSMAPAFNIWGENTVSAQSPSVRLNSVLEDGFVGERIVMDSVQIVNIDDKPFILKPVRYSELKNVGVFDKNFLVYFGLNTYMPHDGPDNYYALNIDPTHPMNYAGVYEKGAALSGYWEDFVRPAIGMNYSNYDYSTSSGENRRVMLTGAGGEYLAGDGYVSQLYFTAKLVAPEIRTVISQYKVRNLTQGTNFVSILPNTQFSVGDVLEFALQVQNKSNVQIDMFNAYVDISPFMFDDHGVKIMDFISASHGGDVFSEKNYAKILWKNAYITTDGAIWNQRHGKESNKTCVARDQNWPVNESQENGGYFTVYYQLRVMPSIKEIAHSHKRVSHTGEVSVTSGLVTQSVPTENDQKNSIAILFEK